MYSNLFRIIELDNLKIKDNVIFLDFQEICNSAKNSILSLDRSKLAESYLNVNLLSEVERKIMSSKYMDKANQIDHGKKEHQYIIFLACRIKKVFKML